MEPSQKSRISRLLELHKVIKHLTNDGEIYGIHTWGIHLTEKAYISLFGDTGGNRLSTMIEGTELFALRENANG